MTPGEAVWDAYFSDVGSIPRSVSSDAMWPHTEMQRGQRRDQENSTVETRFVKIFSIYLMCKADANKGQMNKKKKKWLK